MEEETAEGVGVPGRGDSRVGAVIKGLTPQPMTAMQSRAMAHARRARFELPKRVCIASIVKGSDPLSTRPIFAKAKLVTASYTEILGECAEKHRAIFILCESRPNLRRSLCPRLEQLERLQFKALFATASPQAFEDSGTHLLC